MSNVVRFRTPEQFRQAAAAQVPQRRPLRRADWALADGCGAQTDDPLNRRLAEELDCAWRQLDSLAAAIFRDRVMAARHGSAVPVLDRVGQTLGQLATVLRSSSPQHAAERVPSAELRGRLQRSGSVG